MKSKPKKSLLQKFYSLIITFCFKQLNKTLNKDTYPMGIPCHRDSEAQCDTYWPAKMRNTEPKCDGDGHYLCNKCAWFNKSNNE
jgi:hypothetical protein